MTILKFSLTGNKLKKYFLHNGEGVGLNKFILLPIPSRRCMIYYVCDVCMYVYVSINVCVCVHIIFFSNCTVSG